MYSLQLAVKVQHEARRFIANLGSIEALGDILIKPHFQLFPILFPRPLTLTSDSVSTRLSYHSTA